MSELADLFSSGNLTPHGFCLLWRPDLLALHIVSDSVIGLAYFSIPFALTYFARRRPDVAFGWLFWMFAIFIMACGATHWFEVWTLWHPDYGIQGLIKAATALASIATAIVLWPMLPKALALPSPEMLRRANERLSEESRERALVVEALEREIAERRRTEDALKQAQKLEALGELTGGVAHDFNNLLLIIGGSAHLMQQEGANQGSSQLEAIERAVARGESLTRQLLAFARRQTLQPRVIDLEEQMPRLTGLLRHSLPVAINVRLTMEPELWRVELDPNEFELAIINVAVNARDAMPNGGSLAIELRNETHRPDAGGPNGLVGEFVSITLHDSGVGIPKEVLPRVFEPFFTTKSTGKGTGLGLSQVYGFAKQSGGAAVVESVEGRGTTVTLYVPRSGNPAEVPPADAPPTEAEPAGRARILLVEDNVEVALVSKGLIEGFGYQVTMAQSAQQALELITRGRRFDLVFTDVVMPGGMSGVELARILRAGHPNLPVLLTTGYSAAAQEAAGDGVPVLPKPYRAPQLEAALRDALQMRTAGAGG